MHQCKQCGVAKPLSAFKKGRPPSTCKECRKIADKARRVEHYRENAEHLKELARQWREANPEYGKEYAKVRHVVHAEREKAAWKKYYAENAEQVKAHSAKARAANREYDRERSRKRRKEHPEYYPLYRAKNLDREKERTRTWEKNNPDKMRAKGRRRRASKLGSQGSHTHAEWIALVERFKGYCVCCRKHFGLKRLTLDHVIPLTRGGTDFISNAQPLCKPCNSRKGNRHATDYRKKLGAGHMTGSLFN